MLMFVFSCQESLDFVFNLFLLWGAADLPAQLVEQRLPVERRDSRGPQRGALQRHEVPVVLLLLLLLLLFSLLLLRSVRDAIVGCCHRCLLSFTCKQDAADAEPASRVYSGPGSSRHAAERVMHRGNGSSFASPDPGQVTHHISHVKKKKIVYIFCKNVLHIYLMLLYSCFITFSLFFIMDLVLWIKR